jgi:hypothetical protein
MTMLGLGDNTKAKSQLLAALQLKLAGPDADAARQAIGTAN